MGKIIGTFKYGTLKAKMVLALIFVLLIGGAAGFIYGIIDFSLLWMGVGMVPLIAGLVMLLTMFVTAESDSGASDKATGTKKADNSGDEAGADDLDELYRSGRTAGANIRNGRISGPDSLNDRASGRISEFDVGKSEKEILAEAREKYTVSNYKKLMHRYKVKRNYIPVIIDSSDLFGTERTPALCWQKRDKVNFLLLEGSNERVVTMPLLQFKDVSYRRNVSVVNAAAYDNIKQLEIFETFESVMPALSMTGNRMGQQVFTQNLYVLGGDVAITPGSFKALRPKFEFNLDLFKSLGVRGEYSLYFKKAYELRLLWTDNVIGSTEYQNHIRAILESMLNDSEMLRYDFEEELDNMVRYRLITTEYSSYYKQQRSKKR